jgi:hypothetical protein
LLAAAVWAEVTLGDKAAADKKGGVNDLGKSRSDFDLFALWAGCRGFYALCFAGMYFNMGAEARRIKRAAVTVSGGRLIFRV